jgi:hypothetical protein
VPTPAMCTGPLEQQYGCALNASLLFYMAQKSGPLPAPGSAGNPFSWRGTSGTRDVAPNGAPLVGGFYDGGDTSKFIFPGAWVTAMLSWGLLEFPNGYKAAGQTERIVELITCVICCRLCVCVCVCVCVFHKGGCVCACCVRRRASACVGAPLSAAVPPHFASLLQQNKNKQTHTQQKNQQQL